MAYGLETYSATGQLRVGQQSRLVRYVASYTGTISAATQNITVPNLVDDGTWGIQASTTDSGANVFIGAYIYNGYFQIVNNFAGTPFDYQIAIFRS